MSRIKRRRTWLAGALAAPKTRWRPPRNGPRAAAAAQKASDLTSNRAASSFRVTLCACFLVPPTVPLPAQNFYLVVGNPCLAAAGNGSKKQEPCQGYLAAIIMQFQLHQSRDEMDNFALFQREETLAVRQARGRTDGRAGGANQTVQT